MPHVHYQGTLLTAEEQEPLRALVEAVRRRVDREGPAARESEAASPGLLDAVAPVPLLEPPEWMEYLEVDDAVRQAQILAGLVAVMVERLSAK